MRELRHGDLSLAWRNGAIERGWLKVSRSKTEGGQGRTIPLSKRACAVLTLWISRFSDVPVDAYLFPRHMVGLAGDNREPVVYDVDFSRRGSGGKSAWKATCRAAGLRYRWHDLRHTFVSRLAENPGVSEQTIMALAGHVSKSMLARYSHIRQAAKQGAIDAVEAGRFAWNSGNSDIGSPQNPPQSAADQCDQSFTISKKSLN